MPTIQGRFMMANRSITRQRWGQRLGLAVATLGITLTVGSLSLAPLSQGTLGLTVGQAAQAQAGEVSDEEVMSYAAAVIQMDTPRNQAYTRIKDLLSEVEVNTNSIDMTCTNNPNLSNLPRALRDEVRTIIIDYCNQAGEIVEANGLSAQRFNQITRAHPQDDTLSERIRTAMLQLQSQSQSQSQPSEP
jgi:chromosome condensin MukBEF ATPase and DNA-binding subunit MukB